MQSPDNARKPWVRTAITGFGIVAVIAVVIAVLLYRESRSRFDLPVTVYVCGSTVDLATTDPASTPVGCKSVPGGVELSMLDPDHEAHSYTNGLFGFRDLRNGSSDATLVVSGVFDSSTISVIATEGDGARQTGEMIAELGTDGQPVWSVEIRFTSDLSGISIYILTSPDSPPSNA